MKVKKTKQHHVQRCAAYNCDNNRFDNPELSFFRFPKDEQRCKRWVINSRREDLLGKSSDALFKGGTVLCANHFETSQFTSTKKTLKRGKAIPTLFNVKNKPQRIESTRPKKDRPFPKNN